MKKTVLIGIIICLALSGTLFAQEQGTGTVLLMEPFARAASLGNAGVTLQATSEGIFYNPAAITGVLRKDVKVAFDLRSDNLLTTGYSFAMPLIPKQLFLGVGQYFLSSSQTNYTRKLANDLLVNDKLGTHMYSVVGIAAGPFSGFSFGSSIKFLMESNDENDRTAFLLDFGFQYQFSELPLRLAFSMQNIYLHRYSHFEDDFLPYIARFGAVFSVLQLEKHVIDLIVNGAAAEGRDLDFSIAVEYLFHHNLFIRTGFQTGDSVPRFGVGYKNITIDLSIYVDIAFHYTSESDSTFKFTFGIDF